MAKPELGTKRVRPVTGRKFYDMNRDPVLSPFTGESYPRSFFDPVVRGGKSGAAAPAAEAAEEETEVEAPAEAELVSLTEVAEGEEVKDLPADDDIEEAAGIEADDDTFLEDEEEENDDVADLIDGDIENDEEA